MVKAGVTQPAALIEESSNGRPCDLTEHIGAVCYVVICCNLVTSPDPVDYSLESSPDAGIWTPVPGAVLSGLTAPIDDEFLIQFVAVEPFYRIVVACGDGTELYTSVCFVAQQ